MPARNIYLSDAEYAGLVELAAKKRMKVSDLLHEAIKAFLEINKKMDEGELPCEGGT